MSDVVLNKCECGCVPYLSSEFNWVMCPKCGRQGKMSTTTSAVDMWNSGAFFDECRQQKEPSTRTFSTGAMRNSDAGKYDYEGFLSPLVIERFGEYMHKHRHMEDGSLRDSDNWQLGLTKECLMKSAWRHFFDVWKEHRGIPSKEGLQDSCCALLFNIMGYLHETLKEQK